MRTYGTWLFLAVLVGLLSLAGGSRADDRAKTRPAGMGTLAGQVTKWPPSPVQGPGITPSAAPAAGVSIIIYGPGRREVSTARSDKNGRYRLNLLPGTYLVDMGPGKGKWFTKDLPATVVITQGQETRLNIRMDTGIR